MILITHILQALQRNSTKRWFFFTSYIIHQIHRPDFLKCGLGFAFSPVLTRHCWEKNNVHLSKWFIARERIQKCCITIHPLLLDIKYVQNNQVLGLEGLSQNGCDITSGLLRLCMICLSESLLAKYLVHPRFRYCNGKKYQLKNI